MKYKLYLFGALLSGIWILYFFGPFHKTKSKPKVKVNIKPFIKDSHLILFNRHIHHWLIFFVIFIIITILDNYKPMNVYKIIQGYSFVMVVHGLSYKDRFDFSVKE